MAYRTCTWALGGLGLLSCLPASDLSSYAEPAEQQSAASRPALAELTPSELAVYAPDGGLQPSVDPGLGRGEMTTPNRRAPQPEPQLSTPQSAENELASGLNPDAGLAPATTSGRPAPDASLGEPCAEGRLTVDGTRCLIAPNAEASWQQAQQTCIQLGGDLARLSTREDDQLASSILPDNFWIGASDITTDGVFRWADGSTVEDGSWAPGQPDAFPGPDCVEKRTGIGRFWYDQPCSNLRRFLCELPL